MNFRPLALWIAVLFCMACSSAPKKTVPELSRYEGKRVALVDVDGEATARSVIEVALVNQILQKGTFILVSKQEVETAKSAPEQNPLDTAGIARRAQADIALRAKVLQFSADIREGYSSEEVEDAQLAAERGEKERKTQRLYKVKTLQGKVQVELTFIPVHGTDLGDTRRAVAESEDRVESEAKNEAAHLPPKLRFLEKIANEAFRKFFEQYN